MKDRGEEKVCFLNQPNHQNLMKPMQLHMESRSRFESGSRFESTLSWMGDQWNTRIQRTSPYKLGGPVFSSPFTVYTGNQ